MENEEEEGGLSEGRLPESAFDENHLRRFDSWIGVAVSVGSFWGASEAGAVGGKDELGVAVGVIWLSRGALHALVSLLRR